MGIEGGRIDAAHHNGHAVRALSETLAFDKAIEEVLKLVDQKETLVLVTADHAHTMSIGGYTHRELNITGSNAGDEDDGKMSILSYGNGPGFRNLMTDGTGDYNQINRSAVTLEVDGSAPLKFRQPSASPLKSETHGGDDVGIWATGPWSHLNCDVILWVPWKISCKGRVPTGGQVGWIFKPSSPVNFTCCSCLCLFSQCSQNYVDQINWVVI